MLVQSHSSNAQPGSSFTLARLQTQPSAHHTIIGLEELPRGHSLLSPLAELTPPLRAGFCFTLPQHGILSHLNVVEVVGSYRRELEDKTSPISSFNIPNGWVPDEPAKAVDVESVGVRIDTANIHHSWLDRLSVGYATSSPRCYRQVLAASPDSCSETTRESLSTLPTTPTRLPLGRHLPP